MKRIKFVGLDVHADTIAVALAAQEGEARWLGIIPNRVESIRKLVRKLGPLEQLRFCYEAGPTGYALYWQLTQMGAQCEVVARSGTGEGRGSGEDGSPGCPEAGAELPRKRTDGGVGAGCRSRSAARSGARTRSGQEGSTARAASPE